MSFTLKASLAALAFGLCACAPAGADEQPRLVAPAAITEAARTGPQTAVLSGGCFWGMEGVYEHVKGVIRVRSGYAGGAAETASYEAVSIGTTGHAESVEVVFDPSMISYARILQIYFSVATDPTELNRQGPDSGTQYRGEIWTADAEQDRVARAYIAQLNTAHAFTRPIVTRVDRLQRFYPAESYHQNYLALHPMQPYIVINDQPKIANLRRFFPDLYRAQDRS